MGCWCWCWCEDAEVDGRNGEADGAFDKEKGSAGRALSGIADDGAITTRRGGTEEGTLEPDLLLAKEEKLCIADGFNVDTVARERGSCEGGFDTFTMMSGRGSSKPGQGERGEGGRRAAGRRGERARRR